MGRTGGCRARGSLRTVDAAWAIERYLPRLGYEAPLTAGPGARARLGATQPALFAFFNDQSDTGAREPIYAQL